MGSAGRSPSAPDAIRDHGGRASRDGLGRAKPVRARRDTGPRASRLFRRSNDELRGKRYRGGNVWQWEDAAVTYVLESGTEGSVHIEQALEYNQDPRYLADLLSHKLTVEALRRVDRSGLSRRELARRLRTSVPQLHRLLDPTNTRKSLGQLVGLPDLLDCEVDVSSRRTSRARPRRRRGRVLGGWRSSRP
jgi:hypothetical protein